MRKCPERAVPQGEPECRNFSTQLGARGHGLSLPSTQYYYASSHDAASDPSRKTPRMLLNEVSRPTKRKGQSLSSALPSTVQILRDVHDEPRGKPEIHELPRWPPLIEGAHVRVGPTRPDGKPHPHAGRTGRITKFSYMYPEWHVPPCAAVKLDSGIWPRSFIWVSLQCLEVLPENARDANL